MVAAEPEKHLGGIQRAFQIIVHHNLFRISEIAVSSPWRRAMPPTTHSHEAISSDRHPSGLFKQKGQGVWAHRCLEGLVMSCVSMQAPPTARLCGVVHVGAAYIDPYCPEMWE